MGDGLIHATFNALAPLDVVVPGGARACDWRGGANNRSFGFVELERLMNGHSVDPMPTCPTCLVMLDWRLENPE